MTTAITGAALIAMLASWTIIKALDHKQFFAPFFQGATWTAWRVFLKALFALSMSDFEVEV